MFRILLTVTVFVFVPVSHVPADLNMDCYAVPSQKANLEPGGG